MPLCIIISCHFLTPYLFALYQSIQIFLFIIPLVLPVHADIYNSVLGIYFEKAKQVFVLVSGPDGVVYQREVTSETEKSIYVDLAQYQEGEYTIYFQDAEGNEVSGDFLNEKE